MHLAFRFNSQPKTNNFVTISYLRMKSVFERFEADYHHDFAVWQECGVITNEELQFSCQVAF